jgi:hypothetical protein
MSTTIATPPTSKSSPCGCHEQPPAPCTCCGITCFERPNYFCGHLLTDADLSLEQRYLIEKNKLYHRAIDGHGIACGLKMTCDPMCEGHILVHQGFAVDDCGNDIVVCETARFDVIGTLQKKGMLVIDEDYDDCKPKKEKRHCKVKQCFYVTICYEESRSNYETPFQSSCTSGPKQCLPTRTREGYRFDVTDKLPEEHSYFKELEKRFKECFEINCDSQLSRYMKQVTENNDDHLTTMVEGNAKYYEDDKDDPYCRVFCTLRAFFLNHLKVKPDQFNCNLYEEVACLRCPREYCKEAESYRQEMQEATSRLLYYIQRYQFDCVLGDLIFCCPEPCEAHCLVLGTVEVADGKLTRVCNTPRRYMWSPANLLQVLTYKVMTARFSPGSDSEGHHRCCPDYRDFDAAAFLKEFKIDACGRYYAAKSFPDAFQGMQKAVARNFYAFDSTAHSPYLFAHADLAKVKEQGEQLGIKIHAVDKLTDPGVASVEQAFRSAALLRHGDSMYAYGTEKGGLIGRVLHDFVAEISPDRSIGNSIEALLQQVHDLSARLEEVEHKLPGANPEAGGEEPKTPSPEKGAGSEGPKKKK